jgi:photosystem II stability/assembly factor-like uncharacterized protein
MTHTHCNCAGHYSSSCIVMPSDFCPMKPLFYTLLFLIYFSPQKANAQDFWQQLPFPDTINIANLVVNNQGDIFAGTVSSESEGVYRSMDKGQTWTQVLNTNGFQIYSLGISDSGNLYASTSGVHNFYASYDNGNTWQPLPYPLVANASKLYCIGNDTLLAASGTGTGVLLLRTTDEWITWDTLFTTEHHPGEYISDIAVAPDGTIYICMMCFFADQGGVYKSTDN